MAEESNGHSKMLPNRLDQAIHNGELDHVRMFIEQGVDLNRQYYSEMYGEMCPLALACLRGHEAIMEELLKAGADPNQVSERRGIPVMHVAANHRSLTLSMMRCLISYGADVHITDVLGRTILHYLARGQFSDTNDDLLSAVNLMLENGASFYVRDLNDQSPIYVACSSENIDLVKLFIAKGADVNFDTRRSTMLIAATDVCNIGIFDLLLNAGADRHLTPYALTGPCNKNDHVMFARILDTCDVDINMPLDLLFNMTILHHACGNRDYITSGTVRLLLDRGADVRAVSGTGDTALHYAAKIGECNKIRHLLSYNHPLDIRNIENQTPLVKLIQSLISYYAQSHEQTHPPPPPPRHIGIIV